MSVCLERRGDAECQRDCAKVIKGSRAKTRQERKGEEGKNAPLAHSSRS